MRAGRTFTADDRAGTTPVAVISASTVERYFPGEDPLGRHLKFGLGPDDLEVEIVGVVGDVRHDDLGQTSMPQLHIPFAQRPTDRVNVVLRASVPPASLVADVRRAMRAVDPDQPLVGMQTVEAMVDETVSLSRFRTLLMSTFGLTALLLATMGLYGVLSYSVSQRNRVIGVRVALGASRASALWLVLREGAPLVVTGLALGLAGAAALSRILRTLLFAVGTHDPAVFIAVPLTLAAVALVAMLMPARRAARVDPIQALGEHTA